MVTVFGILNLTEDSFFDESRRLDPAGAVTAAIEMLRVGSDVVDVGPAASHPDAMTDGWPLYESRLKGKLHVISKRYTQRIERHNLNLRQHLARLGRKSLSFSKSVELHDKVIGHYLNIKHYQ